MGQKLTSNSLGHFFRPKHQLTLNQSNISIQVCALALVVESKYKKLVIGMEKN